MSKITIKDVAREAGVSISTVSNALNNAKLVNEETRKRILDVVDRLNYTPNLNGKLLKAGKSKMLGLFTSTVSGPYFYTLVEAMFRECERNGYALNVFATRDKKVIMSNILGKNLDGVFVFEGYRIGTQEIELIENENIKVTFLDRKIASKNISSVIFDSYKAGFDAVKYLVNLGHRKIYFILGAPDAYDSAERLRGYKAGLEECGIAFKEEYVIEGMFEEQFTYNSISTFIRFRDLEMPDAFIAGNDISAIGCIKALRDKGFSVPEDVSVMGFDDVVVAEYFQPPLTTVRNPIARQGMLGVEVMLKMIEEEKHGQAEVLEGNLVVRGSCTMNKRAH